MEASDSIERMSFLLRTNSFADADSSIEKTPIGDRMHVVRLDFWEENIIFTFVLGGASFILLQYDACKAKILSAIPYLSSVTFGGWNNEVAAQTV